MEEYFKVSKVLKKLKVTLEQAQADNNKLKVTQKQKDKKWKEKFDNMKEVIADQKKELEKVPMIIEAVETIFPQFARQGESAKPPVKKRKNYPVVVVVLTNTFVR